MFNSQYNIKDILRIKRMNIFKRISLLRYYRSVLSEHNQELLTTYNLKIDMVSRLYTIWSMPQEQYNSYGETLLKQEVDKYMRKVDQYLQSVGLSELYGVATKERIAENSYRIVIRFAYLDTAFWANAGLALIITGVAAILLGTTFFSLYYFMMT